MNNYSTTPIAIFCILFFVVFALCISTSKNVEGEVAENNSATLNGGTPFQQIDLKEVASMRYIGYDLSVDLTTGVIYYCNPVGRRMTVLLNKDGSPKNINQFISQQEFDKYVRELEQK